MEGGEAGQWILMDYDEVIVHIFYESAREFYDLEGLWFEAPRLPIPADDSKDRSHDVFPPFPAHYPGRLGDRPSISGNAITLARTPIMDQLFQTWPHAQLECWGESVGLPEGQMGNSEVGHLNLGAGRIVYQDITRIDRAIRKGDFFQHPGLLEAMRHCRDGGTTLHLLGLVSDGGVHSHLNHLLALLRLAKKEKLERVMIQAITDGRDTPRKTGLEFIRQLQERSNKSVSVG